MIHFFTSFFQKIKMIQFNFKVHYYYTLENLSIIFIALFIKIKLPKMNILSTTKRRISNKELTTKYE